MIFIESLVPRICRLDKIHNVMVHFYMPKFFSEYADNIFSYQFYISAFKRVTSTLALASLRPLKGLLQLVVRVPYYYHTTVISLPKNWPQMPILPIVKTLKQQTFHACFILRKVTWLFIVI